jgi:tetratricopeptide (TPR) repeat protein
MDATGDTAQRAAQLLDSGRLDEAAGLCERVLADRPDHPMALHVLGLVRHRCGQPVPALELLQRSVSNSGAPAIWHYNVAVAMQSSGRSSDAAERYRHVLRLMPRHVPSLNNLGAILLDDGRHHAAADCFRRAIAWEPDNADTHANLGRALLALDECDEAIASIRKALSLQPRTAEWYQLLGDALRRQQRLADAEGCYQQAVELDPRLAPSHHHLGMIWREWGRMSDAERAFRFAIVADPRYVPARRALAVSLKEQGDLDGAMAAFEEAFALAPEDPDTIAAYAGALEMRGRTEAAWQRLAPLLASNRVTVNVATAFAVMARRLDRGDEAAELIERMLADSRFHGLERQLLHFAAGDLLDSLSQYDRAFGHFQRGTDLSQLRFEAERLHQRVERLIEVFSPERIARGPRSGCTTAKPLFIVGMPRSGTTLVEQILSAHPAVHGAGELNDLMQIVAGMPEALGVSAPFPLCVQHLTGPNAERLAHAYLAQLERRAPGAARITDKLPSNFLNLGLICLLFPGARVIHCVRDPRDTCLSCYFQNFAGQHDYAYDLHDLGVYYRAYERLMAHWGRVVDVPMLRVSYEQLVEDQEEQSRRLIAFCELPWDERCLRFHASGRDVVTASYGQVRRPIYRSSMGRWRHYEKHLGPLLAALSGAAQGSGP